MPDDTEPTTEPTTDATPTPEPVKDDPPEREPSWLARIEAKIDDLKKPSEASSEDVSDAEPVTTVAFEPVSEELPTTTNDNEPPTPSTDQQKRRGFPRRRSPVTA